MPFHPHNPLRTHQTLGKSVCACANVLLCVCVLYISVWVGKWWKWFYAWRWEAIWLSSSCWNRRYPTTTTTETWRKQIHVGVENECVWLCEINNKTCLWVGINCFKKYVCDVYTQKKTEKSNTVCVLGNNSSVLWASLSLFCMSSIG